MAFRFILATPKEKIVEKEISLATLPGKEGVLGILSGHAPTLVELQEGTLSITEEGKQASIEEFSVGEGYAHITQTECIVLVKK